MDRAVVTGGASGIGRAISKRLGSAGWEVVVLDKDWNDGERQYREDLLVNNNVTGFRCDVSSPEEVHDCCMDILKTKRSIEGLVLDAGVGLWYRRVHELAISEWDEVMSVNLRGAFLVLRELVLRVCESRGSVVFVGSIHGSATAAGHAAYAASKAGLEGLARATAVDYQSKGLRANCIAVGSVDTKMTWEYEAGAVARGWEPITIEETYRAVPDDIATVVQFLLSDEARFVNGAVIPVDGGLLTKL